MELGLFILLGAAVLALPMVRAIAKRQQQKARISLIHARHGHTETAEKLIRGEFWKGMTAAQLCDSLVRPIDIDEMVLKTKQRETWKYVKRGSNRFALRITLEDGLIVGWEDKRQHCRAHVARTVHGYSNRTP